MNVKRYFGIGSALVLLHGVAFADAPGALNQAIATINRDSSLIAGWFNDQLKVAVPFNSTAGNVVPKQLQFLGFDVGVAGGASATKLDTESLRGLGTTTIDTSKIDIFNRLPMPLILAHAKIGLPLGFDAGVRVGGMPSTSVNKDSTKLKEQNTIIGIDLRKTILEEGMMRPFGLTGGLNYTHAKGHFDITQAYTGSAFTVTNNGTTYDGQLSNVTGTGRTDWDTNSVGAQVILNKQLLVFNPYIGASANKNFGNVTTSLTSAGTATVTPQSGGSSATTSVATTGSNSTKARLWDLRLLAGFELTPFPLLKLGLYGEYAGAKNAAATLGLRVQFH